MNSMLVAKNKLNIDFLTYYQRIRKEITTYIHTYIQKGFNLFGGVDLNFKRAQLIFPGEILLE